MSNIRPIGDPSLATAMMATFQSIDAARAAPAGISGPRWRILQCAHHHADGEASAKALQLCSGLNARALAEHVQALRWKGLMEMGSYRLSASANAMVEAHIAPANYVADGGLMIMHATTEEAAPVIAAIVAKKAPAPMDPADVPASLRPDCTAPAPVVTEERAIPRISKKASKYGRGSAAVARPHQGAEPCDPVAVDRNSEVSQVRILPPANPSKSKNWIADRFQRIAGATAFLKSQGILVTVVDRDAPIREYYVSGKRYRQLAEEVIEIAIAKGWAE